VPATLGISTRTQTDANTVVAALGQQEQDNVQGMAVPGQVPSVGPCEGASVPRITGEIVPTILQQPYTAWSGGRVNGNDTLGSIATPQITYFSGNTEIVTAQNGNASGAGIMIVNGSLTINGNFSFTGLIIVLGATQ